MDTSQVVLPCTSNCSAFQETLTQLFTNSGELLIKCVYLNTGESLLTEILRSDSFLQLPWLLSFSLLLLKMLTPSWFFREERRKHIQLCLTRLADIREAIPCSISLGINTWKRVIIRKLKDQLFRGVCLCSAYIAKG